MVTKPLHKLAHLNSCFILAKNHMVTKQKQLKDAGTSSFILAKNHMVTKHK